MRYFDKKGIVLLVGGLLTLLLVIPQAVFAEVPIPNTFTSGTPISSSQVNANFTAIATSAPAVKQARQAPAGVPIYINSASTPQNIYSITVTPPANGYVILIANSNLGISQTQSAANGAAIYLTNASQATSTNEVYPYYTTPTGATANGWVFIPFSITAVYPVTSGVASTFYMTAVRDSTGKNYVGIGNSFNDTSITAIFVPNALQ